MLDIITDNLDIWATAQKQKKAVGRGRAKKEQAYGIKKLRELILELAVRGKLVSQDPKDEPASVLLEKIAEEKQRLIDVGEIKKQKVLPEIESNEKPFAIPETWSWVRLAQISNANTGFAFKSTEYKEKGTLVLRVININVDTSINLSNNKYIDPVLAKKTYAKFSLKDGDILLVMVGGSLGKIGVVSSDVLPAVLNQNMWKLDTFSGINGKYFVTGIKYINRNQITITKSTHGHLAQGVYMDKLFPLPPLAEQHRIVAKVYELMALCDQLEQEQADHQATHQTLVKTLLNGFTLRQASLRQAQGDRSSTVYALRPTAQDNRSNIVHPEPVEGKLVEGMPVEGRFAEETTTADYFNQFIAEHFDTLFTTEDSIDQLKQTILQLAVMGKLVPQNPKDEPASVLLEKIAQEKAKLIEEGKIKKQKALAEITEDEKPFELPEGWEWIRLSNALMFISDYHANGSYQILKKNVQLLDDEDYAIMLRTTNFSDRNRESYKYISEDAYNFLSKSKVFEGDIIMNKIGDPGASYFVDDRGKPMSLAMNLFLLRAMTGLVSEYAFLYLRANYDYVRSFAGGTSTQTITKDAVNNLIFQFPPIKEQHRIVTKVNQLLSLCDTLKANLNQAQTTQTQLADTIVKQAVH